MIEELPHWINLLFLFTVTLTVSVFYYANGRNRKILALLLVWSAIQSGLALGGFYQVTNTTPPHFIFVLLPPTLFIIAGLLLPFRAKLQQNRNRALSTFLHSVRVPVEIVLFFLFVHKMVPELMTFEGRNFDILAGLTAPIVGTLIVLRRAGNTLLLVWNAVSLCLVCFILFNGILSAELPFQQFGFEQPNRAVTFFPFVLLPAVIVPIVLYTHLMEIMILLKERKAANVEVIRSLSRKA